MAKDPYKYFRIEARELLEGLTQQVLGLRERPGDREVVARLLRLAHTLKGASRVVKLPAIGSAAHAMEDVLAAHRSGSEAVPEPALAELFRLIDVVTGEVNGLGNGAPAPAVPAPPAAAPTTATTTTATTAAVPAAPAISAAAVQVADTVRVEIADVDSILSSLSGAAAQLSALRQRGRAGQRVNELLAELGRALQSLGAGEGGAADGPLEHARGLLVDLVAASAQSERPLAAGLERIERELGQVREKASHLRLLPAQTIFASLTRAVADAAQALGKPAELAAAGGEVRLEAHVLTRLRAALLHIVRNAVAHGIEAAPERERAGKPALGRIELRAVRRGNEVVFTCSDDGRGIDWAAVRVRAVERGLCAPTEAAALDETRLAQLLLGGGLSTAAVVNEVAGRGVGLSVVDEVIRELKGVFRVESRPGAGTRFSLTIPISLSAVTAIALEAGGQRVWVPLEAVGRVARVPLAMVVQSGGEQSVVQDGQAVPFATVHRVMKLTGGAEAAACSAVILQAEGKRAALGADRLGEVATIVVRPVPRLAGAPPTVAGATLDVDGHPELILNPAGVVAAVASLQASPEEKAERAPRRPILVIDDSLTTRMLEQSILEAAGYEVDTAVSAEDGLAKANQRKYGLFLVDVEMPGMNGFDFVAHTRSQAAFRDIPAILVTSLASPEHRRRGAEVGAYAYMVKGEYDEGRLRQLIRSVIG
jgi:two-component system chemotaxis sensor kinase CheA